MKNVSNNQLPKARKDQLIVKELPDETLVYDLADDKAHCLNSTAAVVWKNCDGKRTVAELRELLEKEIDSAVPEEAVWLALDQLEKFRLLDDALAKPFQLEGMTRRHLVQRMGMIAIALPVIISIVVPTAVHAQSCPGVGDDPDGCPCSVPADCLSGHHCTAPGPTCEP